jgi:hypothetical protein
LLSVLSDFFVHFFSNWEYLNLNFVNYLVVLFDFIFNNS